MAYSYQLGYDDERFEMTVNRNFHCLICFNVLREPAMCRRNQHYFCRACITEYLRRNSQRCPTCADELSVETLCDVPRIVKDYLDELSIRCDYYDRGCRELVQIQNLKYHVAECGFTPVVCGNQGCDEIISKRDRMYHESEQCEFRKVKCHNCEEISTKMVAMDTKLLDLDTKMKMISTTVGNTDMRMRITVAKTANTGNNLADINKKLANIETTIANMDTRMKKTETTMANMDTKMETFHRNADVKFEAVNNEVRQIKMRLTSVKDGFDHLKEAILDKIESKERNQEEITREVSGTASGGREKQHIFVAGGYRRNSVEIFNYRQRLWSLLNPMPDMRFSASSFVYNDQVTLAGGYCSVYVDNMIQMNTLPLSDLTINWVDFAAKLPARMSAHNSVVFKDSLFVTGGYNADEDLYSDRIHEVQLKPPYTIKLLSKMPEPRVDHSTVLCDDGIFIFGGTKTGKYKDNLNGAVSYDLKKNKCQQLPQLPYSVSEMATVKWSKNVLIVGGVDKDGKALNNVIIYNIKTGNSHMLPPMLHKRKACMAVVIQNTIVVLGGRDGRGNNLKSVEEFSFDRYTWEKLPHMKEARSFASAVVI